MTVAEAIEILKCFKPEVRLVFSDLGGDGVDRNGHYETDRIVADICADSGELLAVLK